MAVYPTLMARGRAGLERSACGSAGPARLNDLHGMAHMLDVVFVILGVVLFLGALIYARACANI